jgi:hypothetical protein
MPYMPVDIVRLFDSDIFALSSGDEFKAAFTLWGKAFLQVPAGSLPDDDRILAHLSGAGSRWPKLRGMAMRGWVKCSDGRLYHSVVSEKARDAWEARLAQRSRTEAARAARASKRQGSDNGNAPPTTGNVTNSAALYVREDVAMSVTENVTGSKGEGEGSKERRDTPSQPSAVRSPTPRGSRLAPDWKPDGEGVRFAQSLGLNPEGIAAQFRDYWHAKPGKDAVKLDWPATWRGWCRREAERRPVHAVAKPGKLDWLIADMRGEGPIQ